MLMSFFALIKAVVICVFSLASSVVRMSRLIFAILAMIGRTAVIASPSSGCLTITIIVGICL
jgi:hypothetical protein